MYYVYKVSSRSPFDLKYGGRLKEITPPPTTARYIIYTLVFPCLNTNMEAWNGGSSECGAPMSEFLCWEQVSVHTLTFLLWFY